MGERLYYTVYYDPTGAFSGLLSKTSAKWTLQMGNFPLGLILEDEDGRYRVVENENGDTYNGRLMEQTLEDL